MTPALCRHCAAPIEALPRASGGRCREYCGPGCRMAAMRAAKRHAGLIPRAPWKEADRDRYYARQQARNKYANPCTGRAQSFAGYMERYHPAEWALRSEIRNSRRRTVTRARNPLSPADRNAGPESTQQN